jgi:hypothetical protein
MKTERVVFLATPQFKSFLQAEAQREGVGVAELIRRRVACEPTAEERLLVELTGELRVAVDEARTVVDRALAQAEQTTRELRRRSGSAPEEGSR